MTQGFQDTQSEHRRDDDRMRVDHVIPLPWLLGLVFAILVWAATQYFGQQAQGETIKQANESIKTLTAQVQQLAADIGAKNIRDVERDFKINDLTRRMQEIESANHGKK